MKTIRYILVFGIGVLVGIAGTKWWLQHRFEGIILGQDITIYNEKTPVAELKAGSRFNRDRSSKRCSFEFYLDQYQPQTNELVEQYYTDKIK
jgi:hypothetical protein